MGARLPLLLSVLLWAAPFGAQKCEIQSMTDMVIDIHVAVGRGARFTDPMNVAGVEECVSNCCTQLIRGGDLACNLAIYDERSVRSQKNCYLFHCPELDSCPMSPSPGVLSYTLWTDRGKNVSDSTVTKPRPAPKPSGRNKPPSSAGKNASSAQHPPGSSIKKSDAAPSPHDPAGEKSGSRSAVSEDGGIPERITTQLLHLAEVIDKHLEQLESQAPKNPLQAHVPSAAAAEPPPGVEESSTHSGPQRPPPDARNTIAPNRAKRPEVVAVHTPTQVPRTAGVEPDRTSHRPSTAAPRPVPRPKSTHLPAPATSQDARGADKELIVAQVLAGHHGASSSDTAPKPKAESVKPYTQAPLPGTVHQTRPPPRFTSTPRGPKTTFVSEARPSPGQTPPNPKPSVGRDPSPPAVYVKEESREIGVLGAVPPDNKLPMDDRSGLVAALMFGVAFLIVVIGLISRKVSEARQRNQYTKLDYLINGMYVDT